MNFKRAVGFFIIGLGFFSVFCFGGSVLKPFLSEAAVWENMQNVLENFGMVPGGSTENSSGQYDVVKILVKYKESTLKASNESDQSAEINQKLKKLLNVDSSVIDSSISYSMEINSTATKIEENHRKYPKRAARVPDNPVIPNLALIKEVEVSTGDAEKTLVKLRASDQVEYAEIIAKPEPTASTPDDNLYISPRSIFDYPNQDLWGLRNIGLNPTQDGNSDSGWDVTQGSDDIVIAVYGTGLDYTHPDLANNVWVNPGEDLDHDGVVYDTGDLNGLDDDENGCVDDLVGCNLGTQTGDVYDDGSWFFGHDTMIAGIIGAIGNNGTGTTGINWRVKLMPVKGGDAEAIIYAADNGADIINISWSGAGYGLKDYVDYAYANGMIVVFSSANDSSESINYSPSQSDYTWIIGASDETNHRYSFSNYGNRLDFIAPGYTFSTSVTALAGQSLPFVKLDSLTKDQNGDPAIAYADVDNRTLIFGTNVSGVWNLETVESDNWGTGFFPSLDFDASNNPYISFYDWDEHALKYAIKSIEGWSITSLTSTDDQGYFSDIKVGSDGYPRIAFVDRTNSLVKLMTLDSGGWTTETVASSGSFDIMSSAVSLALGALDASRVSFYRYNTGDLGYAVKTDGSWVVTYPDTNGDVGAVSDLALDGEGNPHIMYSDYGNYDLKYAYYDTSWHVETVYSDGYVGFTCENAIALDTAGTPYFVTCKIGANGVDSNLVYGYKDGSSWATENVGVDEALFKQMGITLLPGDVPFIIAGSSAGSGLYEAKFDDGWTVGLIDEAWGFPYSQLSGTSVSAPFVAGLAGLMIAHNPTWTIPQIYWAIASTVYDTGGDGYDKYTGWGRIDAKAALDIEEPLVDDVEPTAEITSPTGERVPQESVTITGTAADTNFVRYNLLYKADESSEWNAIEGYVRASVTDGTLGVWDATNLPRGYYDVKLDVSDFYHTTSVQETFYLGDLDTTPPFVYVDHLFPDPNGDTTPTLTGSASESGEAISSVEYQIDGTEGEWKACTPNDGAFDSTLEMYRCTVSDPLTYGEHTMYIRATNTDGETTSSGDETTSIFTVVHDETSPIIYLYPLVIDPTSDRAPSFTGWVTDELSSIAAVQYQMDGTEGSWSECVPSDGVFDTEQEQFTCTVSAELSYGEHKIYVRAIDSGGAVTAPGDEATDDFTISTSVWVPGVVDSGDEDNVGQYTSLAVDTAGNYLISYFDVSNGDLKFAKSIDGGEHWTMSTVDSGGAGTVGLETSLAVDLEGNYLISYLDSDNSDVKFARSTNSGDSWTVSVIEDTCNEEGDPSITVDSAGNYLISYYCDQYENQKLKLSKSSNGGLSWSISTIDSEGVGAYSSIRAVSDNIYIVSYYDNNSSALKFAKSVNGGGSWSIVTIDDQNVYSDNTSLAVDGLGNYVISYSGLVLGSWKEALQFARSTDGGDNWTTVKVDGEEHGVTYFGRESSMEVDLSNTYLISYGTYEDHYCTDWNCPPPTITLKFAKSIDLGLTWSATTIDNTDNVGLFSSLAVDEEASDIISYYDITNGNLKFVKLQGDSDAPYISLTLLSPDPTTDSMPEFAGTATENLGLVVSVEYQMDGTSGSWSSCASADGVFDEVVEAFTCAIATSLSDGAHVIYVRAKDSGGRRTISGSEAQDNFVVDTTSPVFANLPGENVVINLAQNQDISQNPFLIRVRPDDTENGSGVSFVEFYVDDVLICTDTEANADDVYECSWDTLKYHSTVRVVAYDKAGHTSELTREVAVRLAGTGESIWFALLCGGMFLAVGIGRKGTANLKNRGNSPVRAPLYSL